MILLFFPPKANIVVCFSFFNGLQLGLETTNRGSGQSSADDYDPPHYVLSATEDIVTLVQAVCPEHYVQQPFAVVGLGVLGKALACCYLDLTSNKGALTNTTHSEISGFGSVNAPSHLIFAPAASKCDGTSYVHDEVVSAALQLSAKTNQQLLIETAAQNKTAKCEVIECVSDAEVVDVLSQYL